MEESLDSVIVENMNNLLRTGLKNPECFVYDNQAKAIVEVVSNRHNVLYIDGTGNGKSESYFIACKLMRQGNSNYGPVIVVEPFNALIDDQLTRAIEFGLSAGAYNSKMDAIQKGDVLSRISRNELDLLYLTPEMIQQFTNNRHHNINQQIPQFTANYKYVARHNWETIPLIVIDEIHYISNVGHDFRTAYRQIWSEVDDKPWFKNALKLGMTATFNTRVEQDVRSVINFDIFIKGAFFRRNLAIRIIPVKNDHVKKVWLADLLGIHAGKNVLVFCLSREDCQKVVLFLHDRNVDDVDYYFARRENGSNVLDQFRIGQIRVLVATFDSIGAGFNKTDIHDVVWMYTPSSIVDFYQGIGRAGRGIDVAKGYLLTSNAWRKDECLEILVIIGNMLTDLSTHESLVSDLVGRLEVRFRPHNVKTSIEMAIEQGVEKGYFLKSLKEDGKEYLSLTSNTTELVLTRQYLQNRADEVSDMSKLNQNKCCAWKLVLEKLNGEETEESWTCGTCSFEKCCPDGDHQIDYSTAGEVCYESQLEGRWSVYALGRGNETVSFNSNVIRNICLRFLPDIQNTPPEWAVTFIPDSSGDNEVDIASIAECLNGLSVVNFITIKPSYQHLKMFEAKTDVEKDNVLQKYDFDVNQLLGVRKLLIYDDCINTGKTIMNAIRMIMIAQPKVSEVCILVKTIYERKSPRRTINQIDL